MPARATQAKLIEDRMRTRRVRTGLVGSLGGVLPSGVSAMAVVVVVRVCSVIGWQYRWWSRMKQPGGRHTTARSREG